MRMLGWAVVPPISAHVATGPCSFLNIFIILSIY
jgi:hypothetical protein